MTMLLKTFQEWSNAGYRIYKGAHHIARNEQNVPLFAESQVFIPSDSYTDFDREEDAELADLYGISPWGNDA
jgi:hypothetical protein